MRAYACAVAFATAEREGVGGLPLSSSSIVELSLSVRYPVRDECLAISAAITAVIHMEACAERPSPAAAMPVLDAADDAQPRPKGRTPAVGDGEQKQKLRCWKALTIEPEESHVISLKGESCTEDKLRLVAPGIPGGLESAESCAEDKLQLVAPGIPGGLESAKGLPPTSPQHGQSSSNDGTALQDEASTVTPISSQLVSRVASPHHCSYKASDLTTRRGSAFCVDCAEWKRTTEFRRGASTGNTCLKITCAACGSLLQQDKYRREDVYNFLNKKIMLAAEHVARRERDLEDRNTGHTKENIAVSVAALDVEYTRGRQPFGEPKEDA